ncbi:hypothetical protein DXG01_000840, partial [Tephrocybe rancida]
KVVTYIQNNPATLLPPCFWSGRTGNYTAQDVVKVFQGAPRNCRTVGDIAKRAGVADPDATFTYAEWGTLSDAFAKSVSGPVYVLLGKEVGATSVWLTIEKPTLDKSKQSGKVTSIQIWEIQADGSVKRIS